MPTAFIEGSTRWQHGGPVAADQKYAQLLCERGTVLWTGRVGSGVLSMFAFGTEVRSKQWIINVATLSVSEALGPKYI
eukprot:2766785-Amphidinium_carterae.1